MKKLAILCVTFIFVALFSGAALAVEKTGTKEDSPLLTSWDVTISAQGQDLPGKLKLEKDGDNFKGSLITDLAETPFKNIKIKDDNTFTADMTANIQGQSFDGTITGKLDGDKLSGEITLSGLGAFGYSGKKAEK